MKRLLGLTYSIFSYVVFLFVLLYLIGFVENIFVGKSIDSGTSTSPLRAFFLNAGLISLFAVQHLVMARGWFKRWWTRYIPEPLERSTFVLAASLSLMLLFLLWQPLPGIVWKVEGAILQWILRAASLAGWIIVVYTSFLIDHFDLFGLRPAYLYFRGKPYTPVPFKVNSLYRHTRHPMMSGFLLAFWATPQMTLGRLILAGGFTVFIFIGLWFEERDLVRHFGRTYLSYRRQTPMLIPDIRGKKTWPVTGDPRPPTEDSFGCSNRPC